MREQIFASRIIFYTVILQNFRRKRGGAPYTFLIDGRSPPWYNELAFGYIKNVLGDDRLRRGRLVLDCKPSTLYNS
jgi:hypothetical protein